MILLKTFLATLCIVFYFIEMARIPEKVKLLNRKPFNCSMCLAVYVSVALYFCPIWVINLLLLAFFSGIAAPLFRNFMNNIWRKTQ